MKKLGRSSVCVFLCLVFVCASRISIAQEGSGPEIGTSRLLQGQVLNRDGRPVPQAIIYLKNTKTLAVKTYIAGKDGGYRFPALSPNVDYLVHAEHGNRRSGVKTLSAFDGRHDVRINLKIDE